MGGLGSVSLPNGCSNCVLASCSFTDGPLFVERQRNVTRKRRTSLQYLCGSSFESYCRVGIVSFDMLSRSRDESFVEMDSYRGEREVLWVINPTYGSFWWQFLLEYLCSTKSQPPFSFPVGLIHLDFGSMPYANIRHMGTSQCLRKTLSGQWRLFCSIGSL